MKFFLYFVYQLFILLFSPMILLFLLVRIIARPEYRGGIAQRWGRYPKGFFDPLRGKTVFWVHAVSVGEVISAGLFIELLRARYPGAAIVFSTVTPTGQAAARRRLNGVDLFFYFPFDFIWVTRSVIQKVSPALFIFLETEIWPNFLYSLGERKIPAVLLNGRISEGGFRRYRRIRFFLRYVLREVSLFLMQTERDVDRIVALGAEPSRVERTGNMKYDQAVSQNARQDGTLRVKEKSLLRSELGLRPEETLVIAGSTHDGEEGAVLDAFRALTAAGVGPTALLIAPRHLNRLDEVERLIAQRGWISVRKGALSGIDPRPKEAIVLLDTLGELDQFYPIADLIFVGGSLTPVGGHNVLEPAAGRKPVFFGPHMDNFKEIADQLKRSGGGIEVSDGADLGEKMASLIRRPEEFKKRGESAYQVVLNNRGAAARNLERIARYISPEREAGS